MDTRNTLDKLYAGGRHDMLAPTPPFVGAEAPRSAEPTVAPADQDQNNMTKTTGSKQRHLTNLTFK